MKTPREIADERFARGELSASEHAHLLRVLTNSSGCAAATPSVPGQPCQQTAGLPAPGPLSPAVAALPPARSPASVWPWLLGSGAVVLLLVIAGLNAGSGGLSVGQLRSTGTAVAFTIANTSGKAGDVLLWVEEDGITKCEHVVEMRPQSTVSDLSMPCRLVGQVDRYTVYTLWSENDRGTAAVARRLNVDWRD